MAAAADAIDLQLFSDRNGWVTSTHESADDVFVLSMPLSRGNARLECEGGVIFDGDVRPGMMRVLSPGERVRVTRRSPGRGAVITIPGRRFRQIVEGAGYVRRPDGLSFVDPVLESKPQIQHLCSSLLSASEIEPRHRSLFVEGVALALLSVAFGSGRAQAFASDARADRLTDGQFARCVDFADSRISDRLDIASWAAALDMSTSEFGRRFYRTTQATPYGWFLNWRIDRAKQLLTGDVSLAEVALEVGFCSQSHFTEAFRQRVGVSPGRWRRSLLS